MKEELKVMKRERVLVVDDAREIREFLREYVLEPRGFEVLTAGDGLQGLQRAFSEQPDLLIVDVQMPNMSGLELLRRLRLRRLDIPAILITAHGSEQVAVKALRLGVRDYVIKPFVIEEMEEAIDRALREHRLREERDQLVDQLQRTNRSLRQRAQQLNALYSIGKAVSSSLELAEILERVVEAAVYLSGAEQGSLMLIDPERGELYVRAAKNLDSKTQAMRQRIEDSEAGRAIRTRQTTVLSPARQTGPDGELEPVSIAYVPLLIEGQPIGVLSMATSKPEQPFTKRETRVLSALASFAAGAIHNARLHERLRRERNQLRTVIEESANPILLLDGQRRLLLANRAARMTLHLPGDELRGKSLHELLPDHALLPFVEAEEPLPRETRIEGDAGVVFEASLMDLSNGRRSVLMRPLSVTSVPGAAEQ